MDDYNINTVIESKNEWCARLTNVLTPCIIEGIKSVFEEAYKMCAENEEEDKYLMTFQNLLNNIPKWSSEIVNTEKERIITSSCCNYLEDLITCVHIIQLKSLTCSRAGIKQKKVDIDIPNLNSFIHKVYINVARKVYINVYLFEKDIPPLQIQKNNRELEIIVKECILNSVRESVPVENILRSYLDESLETDVQVEEKKETIPDKEAIERQQKELKEKELEKIKQEVREKLEAESKTNLKTALKNANKELNKDEEPKVEETKVEEPKPDIESDTYITSDDDDDNDDKLIIDNNNDNNLSLDIKTLDEDPDKLELDVLDIKTDKEEDSINLDIEELK